MNEGEHEDFYILQYPYVLHQVVADDTLHTFMTQWAVGADLPLVPITGDDILTAYKPSLSIFIKFGKSIIEDNAERMGKTVPKYNCKKTNNRSRNSSSIDDGLEWLNRFKWKPDEI